MTVQRTRSPITQQIHHDYRAPDNFAAVPVALHKGSTVIFPDLATMRRRNWKSRDGYTYGLRGTPTTFTLEERLASLEGGRYCVLAPSGLAAITLVNLALLKQGDQVLLPHNVYGPSKDQALQFLADLGVSTAFYNPLDIGSLQTAMTTATRLVWLEVPGSVTMEFPNLQALVNLCRAQGVTTALDNTWAAGLAFKASHHPFALGVDLVVHALTKYPSGGADVLMGSVVTRDEALHHQVLRVHGLQGVGVAANDCEMILRGLPSMAVRYAAHDHVSRRLAHWLRARPEVAQVLHPAVEGSPGHEHWLTHCDQAAGLFSVMLQPRFSAAQVDAFVEGLQLFKIGYSWGGPMSLVVPYQLDAMRPAAQRPPGHLVRFSIGLEDEADLRADLAAALATAFGGGS